MTAALPESLETLEIDGFSSHFSILAGLVTHNESHANVSVTHHPGTQTIVNGTIVSSTAGHTSVTTTYYGSVWIRTDDGWDVKLDYSGRKIDCMPGHRIGAALCNGIFVGFSNLNTNLLHWFGNIHSQTGARSRVGDFFWPQFKTISAAIISLWLMPRLASFFDRAFFARGEASGRSVALTLYFCAAYFVILLIYNSLVIRERGRVAVCHVQAVLQFLNTSARKGSITSTLRGAPMGRAARSASGGRVVLFVISSLISGLLFAIALLGYWDIFRHKLQPSALGWLALIVFGLWFGWSLSMLSPKGIWGRLIFLSTAFIALTMQPTSEFRIIQMRLIGVIGGWTLPIITVILVIVNFCRQPRLVTSRPTY